MDITMKWLKSGGGPLICVDHQLAQYWNGTLNAETASPSPIPSESDYDRACGIQGYLGLIQIRDGYGLILGDMPLETTVVQPNPRTLFIVRLFYIEPGIDVLKILDTNANDYFDEDDESVNFQVVHSPIMVFDSAYAGYEEDKNIISVEVPLGNYAVRTKTINQDRKASLLVHKFFRLN